MEDSKRVSERASQQTQRKRAVCRQRAHAQNQKKRTRSAEVSVKTESETETDICTRIPPPAPTSDEALLMDTPESAAESTHRAPPPASGPWGSVPSESHAAVAFATTRPAPQP